MADPLAERFADRELLRRLLNEFNEKPEERDRITSAITERFTRRLAILVLDSSGFTRSTRQGGIVPFLALLERLHRLSAPVVENHGGQVLKAEADNIFAVFPDVPAAVAGAQEILSTLRTVNDALPGNEEIYVSMGIGFGDVLMVGTEDLFGDEMNLACKLGEDLADHDQILLTPEAHGALEGTPHRFEELEMSISGLPVRTYRLLAEEA